MLQPGKIYPGSTVRIPVNFEDETDADVDPATVTFKVCDPCHVISTFVYGANPEIIKADAGDYYIDFVPNRAGRWTFRWETTGTNTTSAIEGSFLVQVSPFFSGFGSCCGDRWRCC